MSCGRCSAPCEGPPGTGRGCGSPIPVLSRFPSSEFAAPCPSLLLWGDPTAASGQDSGCFQVLAVDIVLLRTFPWKLLGALPESLGHGRGSRISGRRFCAPSTLQHNPEAFFKAAVPVYTLLLASLFGILATQGA